VLVCPWTHGGSGRVVDCRSRENVLEPFDRGCMGASMHAVKVLIEATRMLED
jgi:hypothetical protein